MTRPRNTDLSVFIQYQYKRTILKNKNMTKILFKKHSNFQNFDEIFYYGMIRFRNVKLSVFRGCLGYPVSIPWPSHPAPGS